MKVRRFKIKVQTTEQASQDFIEWWKAAERREEWEPGTDYVLSLPDMTWLSKIFSPERMRLIQEVKRSKPGSISELARLLNRPQPNVQRDVNELGKLGVLELERRPIQGQRKETVVPRYEWDAFEVTV